MEPDSEDLYGLDEVLSNLEANFNTTNKEHKVQVRLYLVQGHKSFKTDFQISDLYLEFQYQFRTYSTVRIEGQPLWCLRYSKVWYICMAIVRDTSGHMLIHALFLAKVLDGGPEQYQDYVSNSSLTWYWGHYWWCKEGIIELPKYIVVILNP
ncbi:hypothetical protein BDQ17DRAFT_1329429 [Cyathus striatus]|nr:hypothetical protein BDQ17DRAFT_1329429 [Cyathus striatus]